MKKSIIVATFKIIVVFIFIGVPLLHFPGTIHSSNVSHDTKPKQTLVTNDKHADKATYTKLNEISRELPIAIFFRDFLIVVALLMVNAMIFGLFCPFKL